MTRLFTSSGYLDADDERSPFPLETVPAFLRVLLSTDGTVTKSLESYFWEPVAVINCGQSYQTLSADAPVIERRVGDRVLRRSVKLMGKKTGTCYAMATSLICTEQLSQQLRTDLDAGVMGIGELLRECGLETYREIVAIGEGNGGESLAASDSLWRTYRIVMAHQPFIQISEFFPLAVYR